MKVLAKVPDQMVGRFAPDSVPVSCGCGVSFLWEKVLGVDVKCPSCKTIEVLDIGIGPAPIDYATKIPAGKTFDDAALRDILAKS